MEEKSFKNMFPPFPFPFMKPEDFKEGEWPKMPFPPFGEQKKEGTEEENKEGQEGKFPPFPFPFMKPEDFKEGEWPKMPFPPFGEQKKEGTEEENKEGQEGKFPPFPFPFMKPEDFKEAEWPKMPFPPFGEQKKEENNEQENDEGWENFSKFMNWGDNEKPELSKEDVEKILDGVQQWLRCCFEAEKIDYTFEED